MRLTPARRALIQPEIDPRVSCVRCRSPLAHHQPDVDRPDRLLGTCEGCGAWYFIGSCGVVRIALPEDDDAG